MKIWFEALTGKQAILFHHLALEFEKMGHEVLLTARRYDYTEGNLTRLGRTFVSVGEFGGASLKSKLLAGSKRITELAEVIDNYDPDLLIAFPSPDAFRTSFGLGIPSIQLNDTPHAKSVAKLTISLANAVIHPEAIKSSEFSRYGVSNFYPYAGIDEIQWIRSFSPDPTVLDQLDLHEGGYIVARCEESKAAYFQKIYPSVKPGSTTLIDVVNKLRSRMKDLDIVAFPRYPEQEEILSKLDLIIPEKSIDTLSLYAFAKAGMTAGGTMGRESALLGTPTLYSFPLELAVSTYISARNFPLVHCPNHLDVPDQL
ncbi:MAG: DUF354 domain-containing protein, partial [Candidatus Kariarchaeaceae archaeon]